MTETDEILDSYAKKIAALLDKADSTEFGPERDALRDGAQRLMVKWQIEEWQLDQARAARGESLVNNITTKDFASTSDFRYEFLLMLSSMGKVLGARSVWYGWQRSKAAKAQPGYLMVQLFGYEMDLKYLEMLYSGLLLEAAETLEARPDPALSFEENIWKLHESAVQWERVRVLMNEAQEAGAPWRRIPGAYAQEATATSKFIPGESDGGVMRKAYRAWCAEIGEKPHTIVNGKRYRHSFVVGFTNRIVRRFQEINNQATIGTELVLYDRNRKVDEAYQEKFGKLKSLSDNGSAFAPLDEARQRGAKAADQANLKPRGTKSKVGDNTRGALT